MPFTLYRHKSHLIKYEQQICRELEQVVNTHRRPCLNGWPRELGELDPSPCS